MGNSKEKSTMIERLVEELLSDSPDEAVLKNYMNSLEIPYSADPVERMNRVLLALHSVEVRVPKKGIENELE